VKLDPSAAVQRRQPRVLDLGCGTKKHPGAFGVDIRQRPGVDLVHDLDVIPWPLLDDSYDLVYCQDIVEHVANVDRFVRELHRVMSTDGIVEIRTPHFTSWYAYNDPTHRHYFGYFFLDQYVLKESALSDRPLFRYINRELLFPRLHRLVGVSWLANRSPGRYEQLFCYLCPSENILIRLAAVK